MISLWLDYIIKQLKICC